ncbi:MAG: hypothetical protein OEX06_02390, partial [Candidatus Bathyarchaeota archaeon]|nr:hypothetical protein [Candidatus Bathyarchaeota archaeon]
SFKSHRKKGNPRKEAKITSEAFSAYLFFSPFKVLFCDVGPAVSADRETSAPKVDVDLNVCASAFSVPGVSTFFN